MNTYWYASINWKRLGFITNDRLYDSKQLLTKPILGFHYEDQKQPYSTGKI